MLTAKTKDGQLIILANNFSREELLSLRKKEHFYCPVCSAKLVLKIGTKKIPHFAHQVNKNCSDSYDRESEYHMSGKLKLYEWLLRLNTSPQLEAYFPQINQRADIVFTYGGKIYAIEFQCSPISHEVFLKRTCGYKKISVIPIWLLGGKNIKRLRGNKITLTSFEYLFLKLSNRQYHLLSFCPNADVFILLENIISISPQVAYASFKIRKLAEMSVADLLEPRLSIQLVQYDWLDDAMKQRTKFWMYRTPAVNQMLLNLYHHSINPHLLPPFLGIPFIHNHLFETNPLVWQTYLFNDFLKEERDDVINFHNCYISFLKLVREGKIKLRALPQINKPSLREIVKDFFDYLARLQILKKHNEHIYEIMPPYYLAKSVDEWEKQWNLFKQNNKKFGVTGTIR